MYCVRMVMNGDISKRQTLSTVTIIHVNEQSTLIYNYKVVDFLLIQYIKNQFINNVADCAN